jgi:DNA-binding MarR family transcriptional regulator
MLSLDHKLTQDQTKAHHQRLILKAIYRTGPCSRADLARMTGLTRTTTSAVVDELLAAGLVMEIGQGPSAGGKPPTMLSPADDARAAIAAAWRLRDPAIEQMIGRVARYLGAALAHLAATLNLPLVILAGSLTQLGPDFAAAVQTEARQRMLPPLAACTQVRLSALGDDDVMLGAAALVLANELGVV